MDNQLLFNFSNMNTNSSAAHDEYFAYKPCDNIFNYEEQVCPLQFPTAIGINDDISVEHDLPASSLFDLDRQTVINKMDQDVSKSESTHSNILNDSNYCTYLASDKFSNRNDISDKIDISNVASGSKTTNENTKLNQESNLQNQKSQDINVEEANRNFPIKHKTKQLLNKDNHKFDAITSTNTNNFKFVNLGNDNFYTSLTQPDGNLNDENSSMDATTNHSQSCPLKNIEILNDCSNFSLKSDSTSTLIFDTQQFPAVNDLSNSIFSITDKSPEINEKESHCSSEENFNKNDTFIDDNVEESMSDSSCIESVLQNSLSSSSEQLYLSEETVDDADSNTMSSNFKNNELVNMFNFSNIRPLDNYNLPSPPWSYYDNDIFDKEFEWDENFTSSLVSQNCAPAVTQKYIGLENLLTPPHSQELCNEKSDAVNPVGKHIHRKNLDDIVKKAIRTIDNTLDPEENILFPIPNNLINLNSHEHIQNEDLNGTVAHLSPPSGNTSIETQFNNLDIVNKFFSEELHNIIKDRSLIYNGEIPKEVDLCDINKQLILKIEHIFLKVFIDIAEDRTARLSLHSLPTWINTVCLENMLQQQKVSKEAVTTKYRRKRTLKTFDIVLYLLQKIYHHLKNGTSSTMREIYYLLVKYIRYQRQIYAGILSVSVALEIQPWYLPIKSSTHGLVYGNLSIIFDDDQTLNCNVWGGTAIPSNVPSIKKFESRASLILIVEKDTIFKKLLNENINNEITKSCVFVTGKGFPDILTRLFLKKLWMHLRVPIFILVDSDPYGIEIMLTYRFGSLNLARWSEDLSLPNLKWLGIFPSEIHTLGIEHKKLAKRDIHLTRCILKRPYVKTNNWLKNELKTMINQKVKAELEGIFLSSKFFTFSYLAQKLYTKDFV